MLELAVFPFEKTKIYVNVLGANNTIIIHEQETNQFQWRK